MDFNQLFNMQNTLDKRIETEHGLINEDLFDKKVLALLVEVGELANETRCFKFWSEKPASDKSIILEEFVDGVHFILSLGIVLEFNETKEHSLPFNEDSTKDVTEKFLDVYSSIEILRESRSEEDYWQLVARFFELGESLGFSNDEIYQAYVSKNKVNHKRQDEGY